jgi:Zn-dependent alcohol dehydrogenase
MPADAPFRRLVVVGIGLIGSSLARIVRREHLAERIVGVDSDPAVRDKALALGIVDEVEADPARAATGADLVVICTPISGYGALAHAMVPMSARSSRRRFATSSRICAPALPSCPATRSPAPSIRGPKPALPRCSTGAGAS